MNSKSLLVAFVAIPLLGCEAIKTQMNKPRAFHPDGRVKTALYDQTPRPAKKSIEVYQPGDSVTKLYRVIAFLNAEGEYKQEAELLGHISDQAKNLGADGLILLKDEQQPVGGVSVGLVSASVAKKRNPSDRTVFRANAIVYEAK